MKKILPNIHPGEVLKELYLAPLGMSAPTRMRIIPTGKSRKVRNPRPTNINRTDEAEIMIPVFRTLFMVIPLVSID